MLLLSSLRSYIYLYKIFRIFKPFSLFEAASLKIKYSIIKFSSEVIVSLSLVQKI